MPVPIVPHHKSAGPAQPDALLAGALGVVLQRLGQSAGRAPLLIGICGAQGSGKTTLASAMVGALETEGIAAAALSLDDLYLTRAARAHLAQRVHPLLATRGVPGTHDMELGQSILSSLSAGATVRLPSFDKAQDDRAPESRWPLAPRGCRVLILEGWCVGALPQSCDNLLEPINDLERLEDADGRWRRYVNECLGGAYQDLFGRIDALILLAAPSFDVVADWRLQQEMELAGKGGGGAAIMDATAVARFVLYYERLTRHIAAEMPERAQLVVRLGPEREVLSLSGTP